MTDDRTDAVDRDPVDPAADDWAPLPEEMRLLHPGELVESEAESQAASPARLAPSTPSAEPAVRAEPDPAADPSVDPAERAMADLKARIAAHTPSTSLVAEIVHREERKERQQRAVSAVRAADAAVAQMKQPRDPLPIDCDAGKHGRDKREEEEWFKSLPAVEQQRLHAAWAQKRQQAVGNIEGLRRYRKQRLTAALIVFGLVALTGTQIMWAATVGAAICCGIWWCLAVPDRYRDPLRALGSFYGVHTIVMVAHGGFSPALFIDSVLLVGLATIVGFHGEMRRSGGFDPK